MKLTVLNTTIRQNERHLFSLVDLHKSSGGAEKNSPNRWLRNAKAKEEVDFLIAEVDKSKFGLIAEVNNAKNGVIAQQPNNTKSGVIEVRQNTGAWVCMDLVYSYAMWISPRFKFKVIRAYDAMLSRPRIQHEKALTQRYEFYPPLRKLALEGKKDVQIAPLIGRSPGSVGYHRKKQFNEGFTDPVEYAHKRYPEATAKKVIAKHGWDNWGSDYEPPQFGFDFEFAK
jgi:hypothetical protein